MTTEESIGVTRPNQVEKNLTGKHSRFIPSDALNRREFLTFCAVGSFSALLASCQSGSPTTHTATPTPTSPTSTPTQQPAPTPTSPPPTPTDTDWSNLGRSLQGALVRPGNSQYATALQLFNPMFDAIQPAAIAYCASPADAQSCIAFAQKFGLPLAPRSGGHSYAGYSTTTGLVLDVTRMNAVTVNAGTGTATIGAGARLIDVYSTLSQHGLALPAGSCPTVGIAGLALGGGIGVLGRKFGLTCDNLLSAQVVLADSSALTCDANNNPDLFWALRGGGGGNFGVVTSFTFATHPVSTLSLFTLNWPWGIAASIVDAWQNWAPQAADELWSNCLLIATGNKSASPAVRVNGVYAGPVAPLNALLRQLIARVGSAPSSSYVSAASLLDTMLDEAGCYGKTVDQCHLPSQNPQGQLQRATYTSRSDFFSNLLPRQAIDAMLNAIERSQGSSAIANGGIGLDASGGAINRVPASATAFAHRSALFSAQYTANWNASDPASVIAANRSWLNDLWQTLRPYANGEAYQNYIDPNLPTWQQAYYGVNLPRLQQIKAAYDPNNFFHFAQSIPPAR